MKNTIKKIPCIALASAILLLCSCDYTFFEDEYVSSPYDVFVKKNKKADSDGYFEKKDTLKFKDNVGIGDVFITGTNTKADDFYEYSYASSRNAIKGNIFLQCDYDGGYINLTCDHFEQLYLSEKTSFQIVQKHKLENKEGYTVEYKDSLDMEGTQYKYVLIFDRKKAKEDGCNFERLYLARDKGIFRIDVHDSISLTRTSGSKK